MKKIIKLTESDLTRIVKRVIEESPEEENDFNISSENILKSYNDGDFIYSKTYDRVYKRIGNINYHDEPGDDGIPTILVDVDGGMYDFKSLRAENVYEVLSTPKGFKYKDYSKKVSR